MFDWFRSKKQVRRRTRGNPRRKIARIQTPSQRIVDSFRSWLAAQPDSTRNAIASTIEPSSLNEELCTLTRGDYGSSTDCPGHYFWGLASNLNHSGFHREALGLAEWGLEQSNLHPTSIHFLCLAAIDAHGITGKRSEAHEFARTQILNFPDLLAVDPEMRMNVEDDVATYFEGACTTGALDDAVTIAGFLRSESLIKKRSLSDLVHSLRRNQTPNADRMTACMLENSLIYKS